MILNVIYEVVWGTILCMASVWAGARAFDRSDSRRMRVISAACCIALALLFLGHVFKILAGRVGAVDQSAQCQRCHVLHIGVVEVPPPAHGEHGGYPFQKHAAPIRLNASGSTGDNAKLRVTKANHTPMLA